MGGFFCPDANASLEMGVGRWDEQRSGKESEEMAKLISDVSFVTSAA